MPLPGSPEELDAADPGRLAGREDNEYLHLDARRTSSQSSADAADASQTTP
jgi:hypothetical protein